jgi:hypothetical protein
VLCSIGGLFTCLYANHNEQVDGEDDAANQEPQAKPVRLRSPQRAFAVRHPPSLRTYKLHAHAASYGMLKASKLFVISRLPRA